MKTIEKSHLIDKIEASLAKRNGALWFPEISTQLARVAWESLRGDAGLTPRNYGTARTLARDPTAQRTVFARLPVLKPSNDSEPHILFELLEGSTARQYEELGLEFASRDEITNTHALDCIRGASSFLERDPGLHDTAFELIRVFHILRAQSDEYDVSYSDPAVPFSIFVSVPGSQSTHNSVRVAESILHEAMHLQLTLVENVVPLVHPSSDRYWSPWKGSNRTLGGILHGLYVFCVIYQFFENLNFCEAGDEDFKHHISNRQQQIATEIRTLKGLEESPSLTRMGRDFATYLFNGTRVASRS